MPGPSGFLRQLDNFEVRPLQQGPHVTPSWMDGAPLPNLPWRDVRSALPLGHGG